MGEDPDHSPNEDPEQELRQALLKLGVYLVLFSAVLGAWVYSPDASRNLMLAGLFVISGLAPALLDRQLDRLGFFMFLLAGWMTWEHTQLYGDTAQPQTVGLAVAIAAGLLVSFLARSRSLLAAGGDEVA